VAITLHVFRNGAAGFIDWLDDSIFAISKCIDINIGIAVAVTAS
jgi:hypothetical protein